MNQRLGRRFGPYLEILRAFWTNRRRPRYAMRILRRGVCDGCALGTAGLRDWTIPGIHLCWIRLNLLHLNTMPAMDPGLLADVPRLRTRTEAELRKLGRLPVPMIRRRGDRGFTPLSWEEAIDRIADRARGSDPRRLAFYIVSRGTVNETYYAAQKATRFLGTNHVDNSARVCHSPSTTGLKATIGFAATTCSYTDLIGSDLVVLIGSDVANNQPVMMKYLHLAKKQGTRIAVINPFREPGLDRYWIPSTLESALFGTDVADEHFSIRVGGDIAFLNGVLKLLIADGKIDREFLDAHTEGWDALAASLAEQDLETLEDLSGAGRESMQRFADLYGNAKTAILVWSMGVTMHRHGVENVMAISNLGLARGNVGRPHTGLMPIRGHSGVQGGAEMGCVPNLFPGGAPVGTESAADLERRWGFPVPGWRGAFAAEMVEMADRGELDLLYCVGGNLMGVLPDPEFVRGAMAKVPLRVHHDIVVNPQMFVPAEGDVILLPATTRYEMKGGNTETSTERRVIYNPEIPGPRVAGARDEWRVLVEIAKRVRPELAPRIHFESTAAIREEIAAMIPRYDGIQRLSEQGDQFQWGGPRLGEGGRFEFPDGKARIVSVKPPDTRAPEGRFKLTTRRGKQFNSMVFGNRELALGAGRDGVVLHADDMKRLRLREGDRVHLRSSTGTFRGRAIAGEIQQGTVMMYWPEANVLIPRGQVDPRSGIPAYREAVVEVTSDGI
jgi:molybdopterin-dependent oxidoreductase alpha subunit